MELISLKYLAFLALALTTYYAVGHRAPTLQWVALLAGSLAFYALLGGWAALGLMIVIALVTWVGSLLLYRIEQNGKAARKATDVRDKKLKITRVFRHRRRLVFACTLALCLAELVYFKVRSDSYAYLGAPTLRGMLVPLGLSFYLLQALGYLIDSYRGRYVPQGNFARYLLFVSYFPQIAYGPINRYEDLLGQLTEPHRPGGIHVERGLLRMGFGALKILAISNVLSNAVSTVFLEAAGPNISGSLAIYGVMVYAVYAYAEFSGVIDIMEGISELFGIRMAPNYRQPFFATSLTDFWGRWHVTLITWMNDYVYEPLLTCKPVLRLGTSLRTRFAARTARAIVACVPTVLTFVLVGLWYGMEPRYAVWGLYNGLVITLGALLAPLFGKLADPLGMGRTSRRLYAFRLVRTFLLVCVGRFFECFGSLSLAWHALGNALGGAFATSVPAALGKAGAVYASGWGFTVPTILACIIVLAADVALERGVDVRATVLGWRLPARVALYALVIVLMGCAAALDTTNGGGDLLYAFS